MVFVSVFESESKQVYFRTNSRRWKMLPMYNFSLALKSYTLLHYRALILFCPYIWRTGKNFSQAFIPEYDSHQCSKSFLEIIYVVAI